MSMIFGEIRINESIVLLGISMTYYIYAIRRKQSMKVKISKEMIERIIIVTTIFVKVIQEHINDKENKKEKEK